MILHGIFLMPSTVASLNRSIRKSYTVTINIAFLYLVSYFGKDFKWQYILNFRDASVMSKLCQKKDRSDCSSTGKGFPGKVSPLKILPDNIEN